VKSGDWSQPRCFATRRLSCSGAAEKKIAATLSILTVISPSETVLSRNESPLSSQGPIVPWSSSLLRRITFASATSGVGRSSKRMCFTSDSATVLPRAVFRTLRPPSVVIETMSSSSFSPTVRISAANAALAARRVERTT